MKRRLQFMLALCVTTATCAAASHVLVDWLKIETTTGKPWKIGSPDRSLALMAGSSLAGDGISWERISTDYDLRIGGWGVAGSSPWEWEIFQHKAPEAELTFLVVSVYDLNEHFLCDFHADVVPLLNSIKDLRRSQADWHFSKRVLSQYPLKQVRTMFPSVGRSDGIMWGMRDKLGSAFGLVTSVASEGRPALAVGKSPHGEDSKEDTIKDWKPDRMLRRLATMRAACQGRHTFSGPKNISFLRMLHRAQQQGRVVVVVLPVSPAYKAEFVTKETSGDFENAIADAGRQIPQVRWVRLDQSPELNSNDYFWDLVHMNRNGQRIATDALISQSETEFGSNN